MADVTSKAVQDEREKRSEGDRDTIKQAQREYAERTYGRPAQKANAGDVAEPTLDDIKDVPSKTAADKTAKAVEKASEGDTE